jgi:chromate transporter
VVGLLAAAFYDPVFTGAIRDGADAALAMLAFALLALWKVPAWIVVIGAGGGAMLFNLI